MIEEIVILTQIIFIDIILAADNAIIIGLIASNFVPKNRRQIILWGVAGALVFKVVFALFATYLFKFYFIKILGGLLLIWIVYDLKKDLFEIKKVKSPTKKSKEPSYIQSVYKVLFADITISFDNVIGVVGASVYCDGQVLVTDDILGLTDAKIKFVKKYVNIKKVINSAILKFKHEVKSKKYPTKKYSY